MRTEPKSWFELMWRKICPQTGMSREPCAITSSSPLITRCTLISGYLPPFFRLTSVKSAGFVFNAPAAGPVPLPSISVTHGTVLTEQIRSRQGARRAGGNLFDCRCFAGAEKRKRQQGHDKSMNNTYRYYSIHILIICEILQKGKDEIAQSVAFCVYFGEQKAHFSTVTPFRGDQPSDDIVKPRQQRGPFTTWESSIDHQAERRPNCSRMTSPCQVPSLATKSVLASVTLEGLS